METTNAANGETEWTGVSEVINKIQNGLYRANATTVVMIGMLLIVYLLLPWATRMTMSPSPILVLFFIALIPVIWGVSFAFGYAGLTYASAYGMPAGPVTPNTDLAPRSLVLKFRPSRWEETLAGDLAAGRLAASEWGLQGIVALSWKNVRSVRAKDSQNIELLRQEKFFGLPMGKRKVVLNFPSPEEATHFSEIVTKYISR